MLESYLNYIKTLSKNDTKDLIGKGLKTNAETGELSESILSYLSASGALNKFTTKQDILDEVADVILCALSIAYDLDFTDETIESMIINKTNKWGFKQSEEATLKFPLPYELHVTVNCANDTETLRIFKQDCETLQIKAIALDLQNQNSDTVILNDIMTSSVHMGNNASAYQELERIQKGLKAKGWVVVRGKIETVPWSPVAPSTKYKRLAMPRYSYFEAHLNIITNKTDEPLLRNIAHWHNSHLSRNIFKKLDGDKYIIMITMRKYIGTYETFLSALNELKKALTDPLNTNGGFLIEKVITEFSIYDSNVSHDEPWIGKKQELPPATPKLDKFQEPIKSTLTTNRNDPALHKTRNDGQQEKYLVLSNEELAKGFMRPFRNKYVHDKCGIQTVMGTKLSETYAVNPSFYNATFCSGCHAHFPVKEFIWDDGSGEKVGS
jgi:hypothetical protein